MRDIPLVDLKAQYQVISSDIRLALERVLERQVFIHGPETASFEAEFAALVGAEECVALSNGTTALELTLKALGVGAGDEVVTVSHTFIATVEAIVNVGATPVLVDVDEDNWTMAPRLVAEAVTTKTKAIVPVHIYGHPADVPAISAVAPGIPIVEDAAQAHLAQYRGRPIGSAAVAATYSFYPGKNLGAYGDGGAVVTSDHDLAEQLRAARDHGRRVGGKYVHELVGTNARLSEFQAAVLRVKLPHLAEWTAERRRLSELYEQGLQGTELAYQFTAEWAQHARHLFVVLAHDRDARLAHLQAQGIGAGSHYPTPCHRQPGLEGFWRMTSAGLEVTDYVASRCLSLPLYPELGADGVGRVLTELRSSGPAARRHPRTPRLRAGARTRA